MTFFSCFFGHKFEQEDNYFFCEKCGKTKNIPCVHKWKLSNTVAKYDNSMEGRPSNVIFLLMCEKCGEAHTQNLI